MSADLRLFQDLPKVRILRSINVNDLANRRRDESTENDSGECRTPTAKEHKIPAVLTCPPAPRKPKGPAITCKRKLTELDFFEIAHCDEVDEFFRSAFEATAMTKRRCRDLKFESEV